MAVATWSPDGKLGGVEIVASTAFTGDTTNSDGVTVGKGKMRIVVAVTAIEVASSNELFNIDIEANTEAASTTWYRIGNLCLGAAEVTGRAADDAIDEYEFIVDNPYDYQIRATTYVVGSVATGITFSITAYPCLFKE